MQPREQRAQAPHAEMKRYRRRLRLSTLRASFFLLEEARTVERLRREQYCVVVFIS